MRQIVVAVRARIYRDGIAKALAARSDLAVVEQADSVQAALAATLRWHPDVLLADTGLAGALAAVPAARSMSPKTLVIALAVSTEDDGDLLRWAEAGAVGFVTCDNTLEDLLDCVDAALAGELSCSPRISAALLRRVAELATTKPEADGVALAAPHLTPRQRMVLKMLQAGLSNKQIAREMGIELATVKNHVHQVLQRLKVRHRYEASAAAPQPGPYRAR